MNAKRLMVAAFLLSAMSAAVADQNCTRGCFPTKTHGQSAEELRQSQVSSTFATHDLFGLKDSPASAEKASSANGATSKEATTEQCKTRDEIRAELIMAKDQIKANRGQRGS